jgi:uncharacterized integral membrane protein (TIGR00698 family)
VVLAPAGADGGTCARAHHRYPYRSKTRGLTKYLLQASVVGLGFGMNLQQIVKAGRSGFIYTAIGISFAMLVGLALARLLKVDSTAGFLISAGTAICGGSAIAAVGRVVSADEEEMSVALGTVFILNSIALLIFPAIGASLHLTQSQFGLWAALAIHDTSSVVGAGAKYGAIALAVATTVKLARALWIVPMTLGTAAVKRRIDSNHGRPRHLQADARPVAVVHNVVRAGSGGEYFRSSRSTCLSPAGAPGHRRIDRDALPDR